jgi:hypothetical protein
MRPEAKVESRLVVPSFTNVSLSAPARCEGEVYYGGAALDIYVAEENAHVAYALGMALIRAAWLHGPVVEETVQDAILMRASGTSVPPVEAC